MNKKVIALLVAILIAAVVAGIIFAVYYREGSRTQNSNLGEANNNENSQGTSNNITEVADNLVLIEGGTFQMGSPESEMQRETDETQHEVTVGDFYIGRYEVTQREYEEVMVENL